MKLESVGILIALRPFEERDCIAHVFTRDHGVLAGMLKGAQVAKRNRPLVGQAGEVSWNARLDSHLGAFHWEAARNLSAALMPNPKLLGCMNSAFALIAGLLPEREKYESLYDCTEKLLLELAYRPPPGGGSQCENAARRIIDAGYLDVYISWEKDLLRELGYALNLSSCSNCGSTAGLNYLSPRTGRAVCDECARPYQDKLFKLPLTPEVMRKFLGRIFEQQGGTLPLARKLLGGDIWLN
ncbi:MAG: DNA repair protein RecO C-terminal domain-containing protein [Rickettsiales bacterium]|jgi:DNA repair protein RecO (recombination protein O)|nr:DNA repair protein RecO C-terminal domain-containing protein [Rickettsiales bacterium]